MTTPAIPAHHRTAHQATGWDRAAILTLGAAACALSYDALQQMAVAIHIRGFLTYLFPLVIDGFIAYGVRALLVLRTAPFRARLYVWTLFGTATTASIWANALHALRLNQQGTSDGLYLGDATVGVLSTIAPLALAGAVHLHILITRETTIEAPEQSAGDTEAKRRGGRPPDASLEDLVEIGRAAAAEQGELSRAVVRTAVQAQGLGMAGKRLTEVMNILRAEAKDASETS
ncbi:hypothetical protein ASC82_25515 [Streptomyces sp. Root431]|uniref:DUF2637 domain-containing protein n=1 Tax=Streptomyces TaxID=1883 RepID=UPI00046548D0|nr:MULTISPECIES: DUF2637 domain-containing protein [Streptomyces]KQX09300.1 hypothetical protein ASC82_25515 [Streptomyces sp. Root431]